MIKDETAGGIWDNGRFIPYPDAPKESGVDIIVNLNVQGLDKIKDLDAVMKSITEQTERNLRRHNMALDETFNSAGFEKEEKPQQKGVVNRVTAAGNLVWRTVTCPFRKDP